MAGTEPATKIPCFTNWNTTQVGADAWVQVSEVLAR
jgi:hypothetical protein